MRSEPGRCLRSGESYTRPTRRPPRRIGQRQRPFRSVASVGQARGSAGARVLTSGHGGRAVQALMWARCRMVGRRCPHWISPPHPSGSACPVRRHPPRRRAGLFTCHVRPGATGTAATAYGRGFSLVAGRPPDRGGSETGEGARSRSGPRRARRTRQTRWHARPRR